MAKFSTLTDDFATQDAVKWSGYDSVNVLASSGQLNIVCTNSYYSCNSSGSFDLTSSGVFCKITPPNLGLGTTSAILDVHDSGFTNKLQWIWQGGTIQPLEVHGGTSNYGPSITYNATNHAWFRITESSGTVNFDTSADGLSWTNQWSITTSISGAILGSMYAGMISGYYGAETTPGTAFFDNFNLVPSSVLTKTQTVNARIANTRTKTQPLAARISDIRSAQQPVAARVARTLTKTQPVNARVANIRTKSQPVNVRIANVRTKTQPVNARIQRILTKTQPVNARIRRILTKTQTVNARIQRAVTKTQTVNARIIKNIALLTDNFATQDTVKWTFPAAFVATGGQLVATPQSAYPEFVSKMQWSMTDGTLAWEFVQAPNLGNGTITSFLYIRDVTNANGIQMGWDNGNIFMHEYATGGTGAGRTDVPYNSTNHRWLRVRCLGTAIYYEASADGVTWNTLRTIATKSIADLSLMYVGYIAGYYGTEPAPGTAIYDNINLTPSAIYTKTQTVNARIERYLTATQPVNARIATIRSVSQPVVSRIAQTRSVSQTVNARIQQSGSFSKTQPVNARIAVTKTVTQPVTARISNIRAVTRPVNARVANIRSVTQPVNARIQRVLTLTQPVNVRISKSFSKTQPLNARISRISSKTQPVAASIKVRRQVTVPVNARIIVVDHTTPSFFVEARPEAIMVEPFEMPFVLCPVEDPPVLLVQVESQTNG